MSDKFTLAEKDTVRVTEDALRNTVVPIFEKMGVPREDCKLAADVLITADLRGVQTHGVSNILRVYVSMYRAGQINPRPKWTILRESPAVATIDSDGGLGIIIAPKAMEIAIEKARNVGLGMVTISNSRHLSMASYHAMLPLKYDMIGMCMSSTSRKAQMVPTFGAEPRLGTNPISVAAPADGEAPFVFDGATTVVAANKLNIARRMGVKLPPGWVADANGTPIMEETDPPPPDVERLLPLGSTSEMGSHKGYGLAGVVDILGGILTGGPFGITAVPQHCSHCVAAYNIESFMDTNEFKRTMDEWLRMLKSTKPGLGHTRVLYPGLAEAECEIEYKAKGIPLHKEVVTWFHDICNELHIPCYV